MSSFGLPYYRKYFQNRIIHMPPFPIELSQLLSIKNVFRTADKAKTLEFDVSSL